MEWFRNNNKSNQILNRLERYSSEIILLCTGFLLLISLGVLINLTKLNRALLSFEILFFLPFFIYLLVIILSKHVDIGLSKYSLSIILIFATLFQLIILFTEVSLSDDVYRFYLEGKAIVNGINPYTTSINDYPLNLHDEYIDKTNHPNVTSPYPPLALILFAVLYLIIPNPITYRVAFSIGFLASIYICSRILPAKQNWKLIIYAWNPLLHLETANGSHYESIVVLFVMIAVWGIDNERVFISSGFLLMAFLLKYYAIILVLIYWKRLKYRGLSVFFSGLTLYGIFVILVPQALLGGILSYAELWYFNASVFWIVVQMLHNFQLAKYVIGGLFILILCILTIKANKEANPPHTMALMAIGLFLLLQPSFHPWYMFWMFPFILLDKNLKSHWILLTGTIIFSYHVYIAYDTTQVWVESLFIRLLEYLPFYTFFALEHRRSLSSRISRITSTPD